MDDVKVIDIDNTPFLDLSLYDCDINTKEINVLHTPLDLFLQEIELAMQMGATDVYGIKNNFVLSDYVFSRFISEVEFVSRLNKHIIDNCAHAGIFSWKIECELNNANHQGVLYVLFTIDAEEESKVIRKMFKIEK